MLICQVLDLLIFPLTLRFVQLVYNILDYLLRFSSKVANVIEELLTQGHTVFEVFV